MDQHNAGAVVLKYVECINKGDAEGVASLTAEEFVFIDKTPGSHVSPEVEARSTVLWVAEVRNGLVAQWRIYSDEEYAQQS